MRSGPWLAQLPALDQRMTQSMSRKANCWDNAPMESLFKALKVERADQVPI